MKYHACLCLLQTAVIWYAVVEAEACLFRLEMNFASQKLWSIYSRRVSFWLLQVMQGDAFSNILYAYCSVLREELCRKSLEWKSVYSRESRALLGCPW